MFDVPLIVLFIALPGMLVGGYFAIFRGQQAPVVSWLAYGVLLTGLLCVFGPLIEIGRDPNAKFDAHTGDRANAHFLLFLLIVAPMHLLLILGLIAAVIFAKSLNAEPPLLPPPPPQVPQSESGPSDFKTLPRFPGGK